MSSKDRFEEGKAAARDIKDTIKEGAAQVESDIRLTAADATSIAAKATNQASAAGPEVADEAREAIENLRSRAQDVVGEFYDDTIAAIRERPVASIVIAALAGAVAVLLARRRAS